MKQKQHEKNPVPASKLLSKCVSKCVSNQYGNLLRIGLFGEKILQGFNLYLLTKRNYNYLKVILWHSVDIMT